MGQDEWEGEVDPGDVTEIDRIYAIMSAYAGPLAEAKVRLEDSINNSVRFDYESDEGDFIDGRVTDPREGTTDISFSEVFTGRRHSQTLLRASFRSDVQGDGSAFDIAARVGRIDILCPLCRRTRQLLDMPSIWKSVLRFAEQLEQQQDIGTPRFHNILSHFFEQEAAVAAYDLWTVRGRPMWDDLSDWYVAQGRV